jgi:chromosome segregation ATPase
MKLNYVFLTILTTATFLSGCSAIEDMPDLTGQELEDTKLALTQKEQELAALRQASEQKEQELAQARQDNERIKSDLAFICAKSFSFLQARRAIDFELERRWSATCGQVNP